MANHLAEMKSLLSVPNKVLAPETSAEETEAGFAQVSHRFAVDLLIPGSLLHGDHA